MLLIHHLVALCLVVGVPLWDRYETRALKQARHPDVKLHSYQRSVAVLWALTIVLLLSVPFERLVYPQGAERLAELLPAPEAASPITVGMLVGMLAGTVVPVIAVRKSAEARRRVMKQFEPLAFFLPTTRIERRWFAALSVSAGICEEILYRGFLIAYFAALFPGLALPGAILLAAAVFGAAHGYQGIRGVFLTGFIALIFTVLFYISGSLWLPMLVHALFDLRLLVLLPRESELASAEGGSTPTAPVL
jgi:membrane protease YdiL (CAAX protease family)